MARKEGVTFADKLAQTSTESFGKVDFVFDIPMGVVWSGRRRIDG